jgi:hypothetical protein
MAGKLSELQRCKAQRDRSIQALGRQYKNTDLCQEYYNGNNTIAYEDKIQFADTDGRKRRAMVRMNDLQGPINTAYGFFAQNRRQAKLIAHLPNDPRQGLYSRNMNALYAFHRDNQNADQIETQMDREMLVNGYSAAETDLSYVIGRATSLPNGEILKANIAAKLVYWDTSDKSPNLLKARWCGYPTDYDLRDAIELFQDTDKNHFEGSPAEELDGEQGYQFNPYGGVYDKIKQSDTVEWADKDAEIVRVWNHQWFEYETFWRCANPAFTDGLAANALEGMMFAERLQIIADETADKTKDGDIASRDPFRFDPNSSILSMNAKQKARVVEEFGDMVKPVPFTRRVYKTKLFSGDHEFKTFKSISQTGYSIKFKTGIYSETDKIWTGMANPMIEPSKYRSKAMTEYLFAIASNSKGGYLIEEDAVEDIAVFERDVAKTDAVIQVRPGALQKGLIQPKANPAIPTGLENVIQLCDAALVANGVNEAMIGNANDNESGVLYKRRIRQSLSKLAGYADSITLYQKEDARLHADLIPVWVENNNGEWVRITGPDGADEFMQISEDMLVSSYDVSIQEAPTTAEDKEMLAAELAQDAVTLAGIGATQAAITFKTESLQLRPIDADVRNRLVAALNQQPANDPEKEQLKALVQQLQSQLSQAEVAKSESAAKLNDAKTQEVLAGIISKAQDAERTRLENLILKAGNFKEPTVTI